MKKLWEFIHSKSSKFHHSMKCLELTLETKAAFVSAVMMLSGDEKLLLIKKISVLVDDLLLH